MGYRGEDASRTRGERQPPWQSSFGNGSSGAGPWDDGSRGYTQGYDDYDAADAGAAAGPQGYGQQEYEPYDGYPPGAGAGRGDAGGYQEPAGGSGYGRASGYDHAGYDQAGYDQGGYDNPTAGYPAGDGYGQRDDHGYGGYQEPGSGYQEPGSGGYQRPAAGGYREQGSGGYQLQGGAYPERQGSAYEPQGSGYQEPGSGAYGQQGRYPGQDAGNDWYGRQPAAASGASFADTGTYQLNGRVIDEYGTGPGQVLGDRDPVRGYPPASAQPQGRAPLPAPAPSPATSGPQVAPRAGQGGRHSGQQDRYPDDYTAYPGQGYGQGEPGSRAARAGSGSYPAVSGAEGLDDYAHQPPRRGQQETGAYPTAVYPAYDAAAGGGPAAGQGGSGQEGFGGYDDYAAGDDPYDDRFGAGAGGRAPERAGRGGRANGRGRGRPGGMGKRSLFGALAIFAVAVAGVAAYVFVIKGHSAPDNPNAAGAIPSVGSSSSSQAACAQQLGTYCHIETSTGDPTPLTVSEMFKPEFQNTNDKISYSLAATKVDKSCGKAVIGADLSKALTSGKCTQVLRASYVSIDGKIMGTIGVVNLSSTNQAHYAGKVVGKNDFVAPLDAPKGVASKMDNGTGLVESSFKGHYLILTWSIFVNGTTPSTKAQIAQLEQFGKDLVAGTVNIPLSQRMVTGAPAVSGT